MTELVSVTTRVAMGAKVLGTTAVLTEASTGVQSIIDKALAKHALRAEHHRPVESGAQLDMDARLLQMCCLEVGEPLG